MVRWTKWIVPGLVVVALLSFLAIRFEAAEIQTDLAAKAESALSDERISWASITLDGRDATLSGSAPNETSRARARQLLLQTYDIRVVSDGSDLIALQDPYTLTAKKLDDKLTVDGFAPDEETRSAILANARDTFPSFEIIDDLSLARGAPDGFSEMSAFGLQKLTGLISGEVTLSGTNLAISGIARDFQSYADVISLANSKNTSGAEVTQLDITPPRISPYEWALQLDEQTIIARGFVASESQREALTERLNSMFPQFAVIEEMQLASNAPSGFQERLDFATVQLGRLRTGTVGFEDDTISISGEARNLEAFDELQKSLSELPSGVSLRSQEISPPVVQPYIWSGTIAGDAVTVSGFVPTGQTIQSFTDALTELRPSLKFTDQTRLALGNPEAFPDAMSYAARRLSELESGSVSFEGNAVSVAGVARNSESYLTAVSPEASTPPEPYTLATNDVVAPVQLQWSWGVSYNGELADVTGYVANLDERSSLLSEVGAALSSAQVVDGMQPGSGAPENDAQHRDFIIQQLQHFASAEIVLEGGALGIVGLAKSREAYRRVNAALRDGRPDSLELGRIEISPQVASPHVWSVVKGSGAITLSGDVASEQIRVEVLKSAGETFDLLIIDEMGLASGAPDERSQAREFTFQLLSRMSNGTASLSDREFSARGQAADFTSQDALEAALSGALPAGLIVKEVNIFPPTADSYKWSARLGGDTVTLDGFVPDEGIRDDLLEKAGLEFANKQIIDKMRVAGGAAPNFGELANRSIGDLGRLSPGALTYENGDLNISGTAKTAGDLLFLQQRIGNDPSVSGAIIPPRADGSYSWKAAKSQGSIVISGMVPTQAARDRIAELIGATNTGLSIVDRSLLTSGEGEAHLDGVDRVSALLDRLTNGTVSVIDEKLSVEGLARTVDDYDSARAETGMWKDDDAISTGVIDIRPPVVSPFSWMISEGAEKVVISGFAPSPDISVDLAAASAAQLGMAVENRQRVAGGAPESFTRVARILIDAVDRAENASASITDRRIILSGKTGSEAEAAETGDRVANALPESYRFENRLYYPIPAPEPVIVPKLEPEAVESIAGDAATPEPKPASEQATTPEPDPQSETSLEPEPAEPAVNEVSKACPVDFQQILGTGKILFDTNRAFIKSASYSLLDRLAEGFSQCSDVRVTISGHTDNVGRDAYNLSLSQSRAQAVLDYVADKGVDVSEFKALGFGETRPIADNSTQEGRSGNRRIEIEVVPTAE